MWLLDPLRRRGPEPVVPHVQSLEFYAHEFFHFDPDAMCEFLAMGRSGLAVMTATEAPEEIPQLLPVLTQMAASDDPEASAAIRQYPIDKWHHSGTEHWKG